MFHPRLLEVTAVLLRLGNGSPRTQRTFKCSRMAALPMGSLDLVCWENATEVSMRSVLFTGVRTPVTTHWRFDVKADFLGFLLGSPRRKLVEFAPILINASS